MMPLAIDAIFNKQQQSRSHDTPARPGSHSKNPVSAKLEPHELPNGVIRRVVVRGSERPKENIFLDIKNDNFLLDKKNNKKKTNLPFLSTNDGSAPWRRRTFTASTF